MDSERDGCGGSIFRKRSGAGHHGNADDAFGVDWSRYSCGNSLGTRNQCTRRQGSPADFCDDVSRGIAADGFSTSKCGGCSARTNCPSCQRVGSRHAPAWQWFADCVDSGRRAAVEKLRRVCESRDSRSSAAKLHRASTARGGSSFCGEPTCAAIGFFLSAWTLRALGIASAPVWPDKFPKMPDNELPR